MKYFSTFSGIGGFELGIELAYVATTARGEKRRSEANTQGGEGQRFFTEAWQGVGDEDGQPRQHDWNLPHEGQPTCVGYSEIDKYAVQIYQKHFPEHTNYGDITKINTEELPDFDLLVGGFPCQAFSIAGKRRGFEDTRGTMFFELAKILKVKKPHLCVFENVKGLLSHDEGRTFTTIVSTLDELGYDLQWQVLNSKNHGVPQNRERVFIVGHLRGTPRPQVFPFGTGDGETPLVQGQYTNTLTTRYEGGQSTGSYVVEGELDAQIRVVGSLSNEKWDKFHESARRVYDTDGIAPTVPTSAGGGHIPKVCVPEATSMGYAEATIGDSINLSVMGSKTRRGRVGHGIAQTLDTGMQQHTLSPDARVRRLTPTECERLQGFPDGWTEGVSDTQRYKTLGNAVTVNVIRDIFDQLSTPPH